MNITQLLNDNKYAIKNLIQNELPKEFDSHKFIQKLSQKIQLDYADSVKETGKADAFRNAHSIIGKYLSENADDLKIIKLQERVNSQNIFGNKSLNQMWRKK